MPTAYFSRISLELPMECVRDCSHPGACDEDVAVWAKRMAPLRTTVSPDDVRKELKEYGAWDAEELSDDDANWRRLIWISACNIADELV